MEHAEVDSLIGELGELLEAGAPNGWKAFWALAQDIQAAFNSGVRYPTREQRTAAWDRFNGLRDRASEQRKNQPKISSEWKSIDDLIDRLEGILYPGLTPFETLEYRFIHRPVDLLGTKIHDWRPVWALTKEIQDLFKSGIRYPTKELREQAWLRFSTLRNEASASANTERERIFEISVHWRDSLLKDIEGCRFHPISDELFLQATKEHVQRLGQWLNQAGKHLSEHKESMLREHKDECFARIQEVRETHDLFWQQYKEGREQKRKEHERRIEEVLERVVSNIERNQERKAKAEEGLAHAEANIDKLEDMLSNARGDEFKDRVETWLSEAQAKKANIEEWIQRLDEWIDQDKARRDDIYKKGR